MEAEEHGGYQGFVEGEGGGEGGGGWGAGEGGEGGGGLRGVERGVFLRNGRLTVLEGRGSWIFGNVVWIAAG